jgi:putative photosynthetic complex assembly protein
MAQAQTTSIAPRLPVALAAGMVVAALLVVSAARLTGFSPVQDMGAAQIEKSRLIRFDSDPQGVAVVDATTGAVITHTSKEGFVPGVLRGLNRMRQTEQVDIAQAYRLEKLSNGQLLLVDPAAGVSLDLAAYGHDNAALFLGFLSPTGDKS